MIRRDEPLEQRGRPGEPIALVNPSTRKTARSTKLAAPGHLSGSNDYGGPTPPFSRKLAGFSQLFRTIGFKIPSTHQPQQHNRYNLTSKARGQL